MALALSGSRHPPLAAVAEYTCVVVVAAVAVAAVAEYMCVVIVAAVAVAAVAEYTCVVVQHVRREVVSCRSQC